MKLPAGPTCQWIDGDVKAGTAIWCCSPAQQGPWCSVHYQRVYDRRAVRVYARRPAPGPGVETPSGGS